MLLRRHDNLFLLNAIRSPGQWKKLASIRFERPLKACGWQRLDDLAARAEMKLDIDQDYAEGWNQVTDGTRNVVEAIKRSNIVIEGDRLRILPSHQVLAFWRDWWAKEGGR